MTMRIESQAIILLLAAAALLVSAGSAAAEEGTVTVTIKPGPYQIKAVGDGREIFVEGFGRLLVAGKPNMPARIFGVAVPPGATVKGVTYEVENGIVLPGTYRIPPCPLPRVSGAEDPECYARDLRVYEANYSEVYGSRTPYPAQQATYLRQAGYRKYNLADVRICPFSWNPGTGKLTHYPGITIRVSYDQPEELPGDVVRLDNLPRTEALARKIVYNYDEAQAWYPGNCTMGGRGLYDYVIITTSPLTAAVQPLLDWETAKGRTVKVVTTSWIFINYPGYDLAAKIRSFLRACYPQEKWGIEDVLLVGDNNDVPMRTVAQDMGYGRPETDYYYSELSKAAIQSWDSNNNLQWGEDSDANDFYGEVKTGRIPWSDPETVEHICKKSVNFELSNDLSFKKNILLLGAFFWPDTDNAVLMELKSNTSLNPDIPWMEDWSTTKLYEKNSEYSSTYDCDLELLNKNATKTWANGKYAFVNWAGHGSPFSSHIYGIYAPPFISSADCTCLNDDFPSVIFANACSNSDTAEENIGKMMLKQGSVGFLGATKVSYGILGWSFPYNGCGSSMDYFFTTKVTSAEYSQGAATQWALQEMYIYGLFYADLEYEYFEWSSLWGNPDLSLAVQSPLAWRFIDEPPKGLRLPGNEAHIVLEITPGLESYVPGSGMMYYRFDPSDPYGTVSLTNLGGNLYEAVLPKTPLGAKPELYFSLQGSGGSTVTLPLNAPDKVYAFDVGYMEIVQKDACESDLGWTIESFNIEAGEWEWGEPDGTMAQPEEDCTEQGMYCFVTGNQGVYYWDDDLDGGPTMLTSPSLDLAGKDVMIGANLWFYHLFNGAFEPFEVQVSDDDGATWVKVMELTHDPQWKFKSFRLLDYVQATSAVKVRFIASDYPNDSTVEAAMDDLCVFRLRETPPLWADAFSIPLSQGAVIGLDLDAGEANGDRQYLVLGSATGTEPGIPLPGGEVLPLKWDVFTGIVMSSLGTPIFKSFMGILDAAGKANATLDTMGPVNPIMAGTKIYFAYMLAPNPFFASNPITITLEP